MVMTLSLWGVSNAGMSWLDGPTGCKGDCNVSASGVAFSDLSLDRLDGATSEPARKRLAQGGQGAKGAPTCPCESPALCEPLRLGKRPEIVAFSDHRATLLHGDSCSEYPSSNCTLNLSAITTLVDWNGYLPAQLYCDAHAKGVRVVRTPGNSWMPFLDSKPNRSAITSWAQQEVSRLLSGEEPMRPGLKFDGIVK